MNCEPQFIGPSRETTDMADAPPTSVLLLTTRWTDACGEVAAQLRGDDELLVIHDDGDPVAGRRGVPAGVRLVAAGEPEGCLGKVNALAAGMDAARHDRLVWTDNDFHYPPDWFATLNNDYDRHAPVSEVPFFVGDDPLVPLLEPRSCSSSTTSTRMFS